MGAGGGTREVGRAYAKIIDEVNKLARRELLAAGTSTTARRQQ